MDHKFSVNTDVEIDYDSKKIPGYEYMDYGLNTKINWEFSLELRDWGIKNLLCIVPDQTITLEIEIEPDADSFEEDTKEISLELDLKDIETDGLDGKISDTTIENLSINIAEIKEVGENKYKGFGSAVATFSTESDY